jgi:hypothetical protein
MVIYHNNNITIYNINGNFRILKWRYWTVPYFWPYFVIFPEISASKIGLIYGRYLQFRFLKWPLTKHVFFSMNTEINKARN